MSCMNSGDTVPESCMLCRKHDLQTDKVSTLYNSPSYCTRNSYLWKEFNCPFLLLLSLHIEMEDFEQEAINEDLIEFAIRESIQDAYKLPCSVQTDRYGKPRRVFNVYY